MAEVYTPQLFFSTFDCYILIVNAHTFINSITYSKNIYFMDFRSLLSSSLYNRIWIEEHGIQSKSSQNALEHLSGLFSVICDIEVTWQPWYVVMHSLFEFQNQSGSISWILWGYSHVEISLSPYSNSISVVTWFKSCDLSVIYIKYSTFLKDHQLEMTQYNVLFMYRFIYLFGVLRRVQQLRSYCHG